MVHKAMDGRDQQAGGIQLRMSHVRIIVGKIILYELLLGISWQLVEGFPV